MLRARDERVSVNRAQHLAISVNAAIIIGAVVLALMPFQTLYDAAPLAPAGRRVLPVQCSAPMFSAFGRVGHAHQRITRPIPLGGPSSPQPTVFSIPARGACQRPARHRLDLSVARLLFASLVTVASFIVLRAVPGERFAASPT